MAMPALQPPAKPRFSGSSTSRNRGSSMPRRKPTDPSVDPLSTTITWKSVNVCAQTELRHFSSRSRRLRLTMTTETAGVISFRPPASTWRPHPQGTPRLQTDSPARRSRKTPHVLPTLELQTRSYGGVVGERGDLQDPVTGTDSNRVLGHYRAS